jgi:hypothetical protein
MSVQTLKISGTNEEGFLHLAKVREAARSLSREAFLEDYPVPSLYVDSLDTQAIGPQEDATTDSVRPQLLTIAGASLRPLRYLDRLAFLTKRPGNPFPHFVSLGRSANNDMVVALDNVSKLHGYFTHGGEGWAYTDHGSTNGSVLNGQPVKSMQRTPLADGDRLKIGAGITLRFLLPESLYHLATQG